LADLQDPEIAAVFDRSGDGKADLVGCSEGWACEQVVDHHLDAYGLNQTVTQTKGDYEELAGEAIDRYRNGEPVLLYNWTPHWFTSELVLGEDVAWLGVPFSSLPDDPSADTTIGELPGCLETPCDLGFGYNDIRSVANKTFLLENPPAARLLELIEIPLKDISDQNLKMFQGESYPADISRHAEVWIEQNRDLVDAWLDAARSAAR
jgi:glycine betaine/proline transport system substrate-binding protein